jgi:hypothetical protein
LNGDFAPDTYENEGEGKGMPFLDDGLEQPIHKQRDQKISQISHHHILETDEQWGSCLGYYRRWNVFALIAARDIVVFMMRVKIQMGEGENASS